MKDDLGSVVGFDWDEGNTDKKLTTHNVENWECEQVFFNQPLLVFGDLMHSTTEHRWAAFGETDVGRLLIVIFAKRQDLIRVISARDMNRKERGFYEENG